MRAALQQPRMQARMLPDGRRLHLNDGPIDLIIEAFGAPDDVSRAYAQACARFEHILDELCAELPDLRAPDERPLKGPTALRMRQATARLPAAFITPMAAVAGAVADEMLAALTQGVTLDKAYVNNGGDIAAFLAAGQTLRLAAPQASRVDLTSAHDVRGIATSGWGGRSHSLGIADAVTVLARDAARADAAATLIANAVDCTDAAIKRTPANQLSPDSDLGARPVTTHVPPLAPAQIETALASGLARAQAFVDAGHIAAAHLTLQSSTLTTSHSPCQIFPSAKPN